MLNPTRRQVLALLGAGAAFGLVASDARPALSSSTPGGLGFTPVRLPHPLPVYARQPSFLAGAGGRGRVMPATGQAALATYEVVDDLVVPPEFERYVIVRWGDRVFADADDYVGYNNDFTGFVADPARPGEGMLWVNHEYISHPFSEIAPGTPKDLLGAGSVFAAVAGYALPAKRTMELLGEALYNLGGSALRLRRDQSGRFAVVAGHPMNRRVHGLSGLAINGERRDDFQPITAWGRRPHQIGDANYLIGTGPAAAEVFERINTDTLGNRIIGTAYNCAGAVTPWGTVLTCEENDEGSTRQYVGVQEEVGRDGGQLGYVPDTVGAAFGLVGEKYGWVVEIDPADPSFRGRKHTALGRFRHENVALRAVKDQALVAYMGDDRRGGHVWRFVSTGVVKDPADRGRNSRLLEDGTLFVARFDPPTGDAMSGTGRWIPLRLSAPTAPLSPSVLASVELAAAGAARQDGLLRLPRRRGIAGETEDGGLRGVTIGDEAAVLPGYHGKTLGDFYDTTGAMLCDAFAAGNLVGGTPTARPEEVQIHPTTGEVYIAFTLGKPGSDGNPDSRNFVTGKYTADVTGSQPFGGLYKIRAGDADAAGDTFVWERILQSGEAGAKDGGGFASIDNIAFTSRGDLLCLTDVSDGYLNGITSGAEPRALVVDHAGTGRAADTLESVFGNNWAFVIPAAGPEAGTVVPIACGPMRSELTGPTFVGDDTLILSVQHPGADVPFDKAGRTVTRDLEMLDLDGRLFTQKRTVPLGGNWPSNIEGNPSGPPRPAVVGIRRKDGGRLL